MDFSKLKAVVQQMYPTLDKLKKIATVIELFTLPIVSIVICYFFLSLVHQFENTNKTLECVLVEVHGAVADIRSMAQSGNTVLTQSGTLVTTSNLVLQHADQTVQSATATVNNLNTHLFNEGGLIPAATDLVNSAHELVTSMHQGVDETFKNVNATFPAIQSALQHIEDLTDTLDTEVKAGSPKALQTIDSLNKAIVDLDTLIADPNIKTILAESAGTTHNLNEATLSVEIALRQLRQKAGIFMTVLKTLFNVLKVTIPIP